MDREGLSMDDLISRQTAIDAMIEDKIQTKIYITPTAERDFEVFNGACDRHAKMLKELPSAQSEPSEITDEQAILHLQSTGWMQNHDCEMYESGLRERLADDSEAYDSLVPCEDTISRQALIKEFSDFVRASNNSDFARTPTWNDAVSLVRSMPSAQPTLYGYKIEHLAYIARVMQKEGVTAKYAVRTFDDMSRTLRMIIEEAQERVEKSLSTMPFDVDYDWAEPNGYCHAAERREEP